MPFQIHTAQRSQCNSKPIPRVKWLVLIIVYFVYLKPNIAQNVQLDMKQYIDLVDSHTIYPSPEQIAMLEPILPRKKYEPAPNIYNRTYWQGWKDSSIGRNYLTEANDFLDQEPEVPISDEIYRRANKEGNRQIYKPRYYRTMDRLEKFIIAECMTDSGKFLPQIHTYIHAILEMKSWLHPNHDDSENTVLEGKRVTIDLGARKFALVLSMANALLDDKLDEDVKQQINEHIEWRITDSYLSSCPLKDPESNKWIRSTSNWNSVCTSGTVYSTIVNSDDHQKRLLVIGCALNSMKFYLSGFGQDGYCSEGTGYWSYGFGHYLYLAEILYDYTDGKIDLFKFNNPEKLKNVAQFPKNYQLYNGLYAPFSDGVTRVKSGSDNFAYFMASKHYGIEKPNTFISDEVAQSIIYYSDSTFTRSEEKINSELPEYSYFDDFGIVISRGHQNIPFSIAIKAGHNAENHNHSDVGSYVISLGNEIMTGDIGAPSYTAGAFSESNPARSSWGHPVPIINDVLQSNGKSFSGKILETHFEQNKDVVTIDIAPAYDIPQLNALVRTVVNDKTQNGSITIQDKFMTSEGVNFGTSIMTLNPFEIVNEHSIIIQTGNRKILAEIEAEGRSFTISAEKVPVEHLREGGPAFRIGILLNEPSIHGTVTIRYTPL